MTENARLRECAGVAADNRERDFVAERPAGRYEHVDRDVRQSKQAASESRDHHQSEEHCEQHVNRSTTHVETEGAHDEN